MPILNSILEQSILAHIPLEGGHYFNQANMVPKERIELPTYALQVRCTTAVLFGLYSAGMVCFTPSQLLFTLADSVQKSITKL